jgi:hypothetical protein
MKKGDVHPSAFSFTMDCMAAKGAEGEPLAGLGKRTLVSTCNLEEWF